MYLNFMPSCLQPPVASSCSLLYVAFSSRGVPAIYGGTGGFASCQQARQARPAESSSLALRAGVSPPVALHMASRPRSYLQLRTHDAHSVRTFTSRIGYTLRRTGTGVLARARRHKPVKSPRAEFEGSSTGGTP